MLSPKPTHPSRLSGVFAIESCSQLIKGNPPCEFSARILRKGCSLPDPDGVKGEQKDKGQSIIFCHSGGTSFTLFPSSLKAPAYGGACRAGQASDWQGRGPWQGAHLTLQWSWPQLLKWAVPLGTPPPSFAASVMVPGCNVASSEGWVLSAVS